MSSIYRLFSIAFLIFVILNPTTSTATENASITPQMTVHQAGSMPLAFTANEGQWDERVRFRADAGGAVMWFTSEGAYYQFTRPISDGQPSDGAIDPSYGGLGSEPERYETMMIKASFVGGNPDPVISGAELTDYRCNYFIGNEPEKWRTDVANYGAVLYEQVYDGIDLKYYGNGKQMEYDFIVSPGADYSQVQIHYEGAESVTVNADGELVVETEWGEVVEQRPVVFQIVNGSRVPVSGLYRLLDEGSFGFDIGDYDRSLPLVIDPVLEYSTYLGGSGDDYGTAVAVDVSGAAYIVGSTGSVNFPLVGAYQADQGDRDAFVTRFNSSGTALEYSTYIGGSGADYSSCITLGSSGHAYIAGRTYSGDFPTVNAYQSDQLSDDAYVLKLGLDGSSLVYSTYLGGSDSEDCLGIAVDVSGNAYVTGTVVSTDFPTQGAYLSDQPGYDAYVTKLSSNGSSLVYSTYLGGNSSDYGRGLALDEYGNAYIVGSTYSDDFPIIGGIQNPNLAGADIFVTKLNASGSNPIFSTYLGGNSEDYGEDIALDGSGNSYVTGTTYSTNFYTVGAFQTSHSATECAFVSKISGSGSNLIYSTYLGGDYFDEGKYVTLGASGEAWVIGNTKSSDFPTEGALQTYQGEWDVFLTGLNSSGTALTFSTYLGGSLDDAGQAVAVDGSGNIYLTGYTASTDFPLQGQYQSDQAGYDAFVVKLSGAVEVAPDTIRVANVSAYPGEDVVVAVDCTSLCDLWQADISLWWGGGDINLDSVKGGEAFAPDDFSATTDNLIGTFAWSLTWLGEPLAPVSGNMMNLYYSIDPYISPGVYPIEVFMTPEFNRDCGGGAEVVTPVVLEGAIIVDDPPPTFCDYFSGPFCDDFDYGISPLWTGWTGLPGDCTWEVTDGTYGTSQTGSNQLCMQSVTDPGWANYTFEVDVRGNAGNDKRILFRVQDSLNYYDFFMTGEPLSLVGINKYVGGAHASQVSEPFSSTTGVWYDIAVECFVDTLTVYIDDTEVLQFIDSDSPILSGGIGLVNWTGDAGICDVSFDNARVTALPDVDGDGVLDEVDNCPSDYNPSQLDFDGDGEGNACEWTTTSNEWIDVYCYGDGGTAYIDGEPFQKPLWLRAFDPDGVCCGLHYSLTGHDYSISIYADDPLTPDVDEGALPGDTIWFTYGDVLCAPDPPLVYPEGYEQIRLCTFFSFELDNCCGEFTGGITGNANCSDDGKLTLSDISRMIDYLYISKADLCCYASGNTNGSWDDGDCKITLSDISRLIDVLYISKQPPADCMPECER